MKNRSIVLLLVITLLGIFLGCDQNFMPDRNNAGDRVDGAVSIGTDITAKVVKDTGVIKYINLEGGFYGIVGKLGNYDPVNLPKEFQKDGLKVQFTGELLDIPSIHMWGKIVRLISIQTTGSIRKMIMDTGAIHQKLIQGKPWIIEATTGSYQPTNLPKEFMVENLKVMFVGVIRTDIVIVPALWPVIELLRIEKVGENPIIVNLKEEFKLQVGSTASVPGNGILFTFKSVLQDSRCPIGVECVWQGEAIILVNVVIGGVNYGDYKMSTLRPSNVITAGYYSFQLNNLVPYPVYEKPTDQKSYVGYFIIYPIKEVTTL